LAFLNPEIPGLENGPGIAIPSHEFVDKATSTLCPTVMLSPQGQSGPRPKFWPRPRSFGLGLEIGLGLATISLSYYVIGYFSCKIREFCKKIFRQ